MPCGLSALPSAALAQTRDPAGIPEEEAAHRPAPCALAAVTCRPCGRRPPRDRACARQSGARSFTRLLIWAERAPPQRGGPQGADQTTVPPRAVCTRAGVSRAERCWEESKVGGGRRLLTSGAGGRPSWVIREGVTEEGARELGSSGSRNWTRDKHSRGTGWRAGPEGTVGKTKQRARR